MGRTNASGSDLVGRVIDKCRILSRLGRGSMGHVYLAEHTGLQRRVAIKILPEERARSSSFVEHFRREAISTARLEHPNIVQVHDVGAYEGMPYLIMQYVEGFTVAEILKRSQRLDLKEAARVARDVARALAAAHAAGLVHRDIKPANILISENNEVRLADFGVAQDSSSGKPLKDGSALTGTPHYASPEQIAGNKATPRSDLYALGATLFTMIAGRPPFTGDTPREVIAKHVRQPPPRVSALVPETPKFLDDLILRLLSKNPAKRFESADEVERELDRFVRGTYMRTLRETSSIKRQKKSLPIPLLASAAGVTLGAILLLILLVPGEEAPPPAAVSKTLRDAAAAEKAGDFNTAITLYRKEGDEEGIRRASRKRRERREQDELLRIDEALREKKMKTFRTLAANFLREFPDSPSVATVRAKLGKADAGTPKAPAADVGFQPLYRGSEDSSLWRNQTSIRDFVTYAPDAIEVSMPGEFTKTAYLALREPSLEEGTLKFEIMVASGKVEVAFGRLFYSVPAPDGKRGVTRIGIGSLLPGQYASIEVEVKGGRVRVCSPPFLLGEVEIAGKASPYGLLGFTCSAGAKFRIRNPRLKIGRTAPR